MTETPQPGPESLIQTLAELLRLVEDSGAQPIYHLAENAVMYWLRVADGKERVLPRLTVDGHLPAAFHFGMEREAGQRIDSEVPGRDPRAFDAELAQRLERLRERLEAYFTHEGYRSSSEQCDQTMLEVNQVSRFLGACVLEAELPAGEGPAGGSGGNGEPAPPQGGAGGNGGEGSPAEGAADAHAREAVRHLRNALCIYEPALNEVVASWEQNSLNHFDRGLKAVMALLELPEAQRAAQAVPPGYPFRARGQPRLKISMFETDLRPLRSKSMFTIRFGQLLRRIEEDGAHPIAMPAGLLQDMRDFNAMVRHNTFMIAHETSFWETHRPGLPLIRGRPDEHPFLMDPIDFFKKAVLFHNRTYTVAGGGVDRIYLQAVQLERYYKFHLRQGTFRAVRLRIGDCLRRWEENKWEGFTEALLNLAGFLRDRPREGAS